MWADYDSIMLDVEDAECVEAMEEMEEDVVCNQVVDSFERNREFQSHLIQQSGGAIDPNVEGRIDFVLEPFKDRISNRMGVRERIFQTTMRQTGNFIDQPQLSSALERGLRDAMDQVLETDMHDLDQLYFTIASDRFSTNFQGWGVTVGEWRTGGDRVDAVFTRLGNALNSNENFEMNDSFQVTITRVRRGPQGSGRKRKNKPGHKTLDKLEETKKSVIRINNKDDLCCARAIVTAKAKVDNHPAWKTIKQGGKMQKMLAFNLHREAGVPQGLCGYDKLVKFQEHLTEYRLILVDADRDFACKGFSGGGKPGIILLYAQEHYDVITSLPGFFGSSYTCAHCFKPFDHQGEHKCEKNTTFCGACRQLDCQDFLEALPRGLKATRKCHHCFREFFGETCFQAHLTKDRKMKTNPNQAVCQTVRRCKTCFKLETKPGDIQRHKCGHGTCPACGDYVNLKEHKCFIKAEKKKRKRTVAAKPSKRQRMEDFIEDDVEEEEEKKAPIHVFFDIEAMQTGGEHEANLLIAETDETDEPYIFEGSNCVLHFLEWLEELTEDDSRQVTVIAHNFSGYDGYFIVHDYYGSNQVIQQIRNGAKLLYVRHDSI